MNDETIECSVFIDPFPHLIIENFYSSEELKLIWEELNFYTKPGKLLPAKNFGGIESMTNSSGLCLDMIYKKGDENHPNYRNISNILTVNRKIFDSGIVKILSESDISCRTFARNNYDLTKIRYYHNEDYYESHTDVTILFLTFTYFHREPKKFIGGELYFPPFDYEFPCNNNSLIMFPGYVEHGVKKVEIKHSDYYDGYGRYCISSFSKIVDTPERYNYL